MEKSFTITMISKDKNKFEYTVKALNEDIVIEKTKEKITTNGWEQYSYKVFNYPSFK